MAVLTTFLFLHSLYISYYQQPNYSHRLPSYCNTLFSLFVSGSQCITVVIINTTKITTLVRYSKHFSIYFLCFKTSFLSVNLFVLLNSFNTTNIQTYYNVRKKNSIYFICSKT